MWNVRVGLRCLTIRAGCVGFTFNTNKRQFHPIATITAPNWTDDGVPTALGTPSASISAVAQISSAQEPQDLRGIFTYAGGSANELTAEYFTNGDKCHPIWGVIAGPSAGFPPAEIHGGQSETIVIDLTDPSHPRAYA
jgi:hypothetical protein